MSSLCNLTGLTAKYNVKSMFYTDSTKLCIYFLRTGMTVFYKVLNTKGLQRLDMDRTHNTDMQSNRYSISKVLGCTLLINMLIFSSNSNKSNIFDAPYSKHVFPSFSILYKAVQLGSDLDFIKISQVLPH